MSFLSNLNNAFEQNHIETSKERLARMERAKEEQKKNEAVVATNFLRLVILGENNGGHKMPAMNVATQKMFEAVHGLVPENIAVVKEFLREFPNRLFYQQIPEFCQQSGLGDFVAELYMSRLFSLPTLKPCWQKPVWIKEDEDDSEDFFFAVVSLFASMLAIGAGKREFSRVGEAIYDCYFQKIEKMPDPRLENLLVKVIQSGVYYIPKPKSFPTAAEAAKMKGDEGGFVEEEYRSRYTSPQPKNGLRRHSIATVSLGEALSAKGTEMPKVKMTARRKRVQELATA